MNTWLGKPGSLVRVLWIAVVASGLVWMMAGCEEESGRSLGVSPGNVTIGRNVATFTLAVVSGTGDLSLPLQWSVVNPQLGTIMQSSGFMAVYANTGQVGVNTVTVRDQYGSDGFAVITQVAYDTEQPAMPTTPTTPTTPETPDDNDTGVLPASQFPGQLSVAGGEPSVTGVTGDVEIFNIQRDLSGDTVSYNVTYNGQTYSYP